MCVFVILKESELHHSIGSLIDGAHPAPRTNRGRYCPKTFEAVKVNLYWSLDLGEPDLSGSLCCDEAQILSKSQTHSNYHLSTIITKSRVI